MKVKICILLALVILCLSGCSQSIVTVEATESAQVGVLTIEISNIEYSSRDGYKLMKVELSVTNDGNNRVDLPGEFSVFVSSGDKIYNTSSTSGVMTGIEPMQTVKSEFFFHIPDALYDSEDEILLRIYQRDGYKHTDETAWQIR